MYSSVQCGGAGVRLKGHVCGCLEELEKGPGAWRERLSMGSDELWEADRAGLGGFCGP